MLAACTGYLVFFSLLLIGQQSLGHLLRHQPLGSYLFEDFANTAPLTLSDALAAANQLLSIHLLLVMVYRTKISH
jgi:hypothetical protein